MRLFRQRLVLLLAALASALAASQAQTYPREANAPNLQVQAEQLFALANQSRAEAGAARLRWDPALAAAALFHCRLMAQQGPIAHRYNGEPDLTTRAAQAGAHFSLIEENVAVGSTAGLIHQAWMNSPGHRTNLLNPGVDRVGIAVVASRGILYAVADYERAVQSMPPAQIEARVAGLIRPSGITILGDPSQARAACATDHGMPAASGALQPGFIMRWQDSDLSRLPQALVKRLASGGYRRAAVGSCAPQGEDGSFTAYRLAVILY